MERQHASPLRGTQELTFPFPSNGKVRGKPETTGNSDSHSEKVSIPFKREGTGKGLKRYRSLSILLCFHSLQTGRHRESCIALSGAAGVIILVSIPFKREGTGKGRLKCIRLFRPQFRKVKTTFVSQKVSNSLTPNVGVFGDTRIR